MASETTAVTSSQNINQLIEQGDWAEVVTRFKIPLVALFVIIVGSVVGWGFYNNKSNEMRAQMDDKLFQYDRDFLSPLSSKKVQAPAAIEAFEKLKAEVKNYQGVNALGIRLADVLEAQSFKEQARPIIEDVFKNSDSAYIRGLAGMRLATLLEDLGDLDGSEKVLLQLASEKVKLMEPKTYLDLGRIALLKGDQAKAREHFQYVLDNTQEQEFLRMARLYLSQLAN